MKSLRSRLTLWFGASLAVVLVFFAAITRRVLEEELHHKTWQRDYPDHPDWKLHGSYSEAEIDDMLGEQMETALLYGLPLALTALLIGYWLARKSVKPIARLNEQLSAIRAPNLARRIELEEMDVEFQDLVRHMNELLARLDKSFKDLSEYSARVAHELRTPLSLLRLKLEQTSSRVPPEIVEEFQSELHQLSYVVDQSLLLAKAVQGRLILQPQAFDLGRLLAEVAEDFSLLAQDEGRTVQLATVHKANVIADPRYTRQILHNLLSNSLKHGQGEIRAFIRTTAGSTALTISNRVRIQSAAPLDSLGFGLRVVDTLLNLQPDIQCRRRRLGACYVVRLIFPKPVISSDFFPSRSLAEHHAA